MKYKLKQSTEGPKLSISTISTGNCQTHKHKQTTQPSSISAARNCVHNPNPLTGQIRNHDGGKPLELDKSKSRKNATVFQLAAD